MPIEESHRETDLVQIEMLRKMGGARRLALMASLSSTVIRMSKRAIRRANPGMSDAELAIEFVRLVYGQELATRMESRRS